MNYDFENPYIEFDSVDSLYRIYEIEVVSKITELSRQLRTFLNYKTAIIEYRFKPNLFSYTHQEKYKSNEIEFRLKYTTSKFINLLNQIKGRSVSYEIELKKKILDLLANEVNKNQIKNLMIITKDLFSIIHLLSEHEIYLDPLLFRLVLNLSQEACIVYKILNEWASGFYDELRLNYAQLYDELNKLILANQKEKNNYKHQDFEEGLKE